MTRLDNDLISRKDLLEALKLPKGVYLHIVRFTGEHIANLITKAPTIEAQSNEPIALLALNNTQLKKRIGVLEDLLTSAANIARRKGENTHWDRFIGQLIINGIGDITPKTFRVLPSDDEYIEPTIEADSGEAVGLVLKPDLAKLDGINHKVVNITLRSLNQSYWDKTYATVKLYTSPQKQWVELTDKQIHDVIKSVNLAWVNKTVDLSRAISAKLKEVNHG